MEGVRIIELEKVKDDERGTIHQFSNREVSDLLLVKRNKGSVSAAHYHVGKSKEKDPETVVLLEGKAKIIFKNVKTGEHEEGSWEKPVKFLIDPFIYHEIHALTDVILLDMNSIGDDLEDTIKGDKHVK